MDKIAILFVVLGLLPVGNAEMANAKPRQAAAAELRAASALVGDPARGFQLFATCAACHGVDGMGQPDGSVPVIAAQHASVVLRQLVDYRYSLRWDLRMEHVAQLRNLQLPQDLADVAAYVSALPQQLDRIGMGSNENVGLGANRFIERCADCHGASGQGKAARSIPNLAGQQQAYLLRQFVDVLEGRRPELGATHRRFMNDFDQAVADGIAAYLSRTARVSVAQR